MSEHTPNHDLFLEYHAMLHNMAAISANCNFIITTMIAARNIAERNATVMTSLREIHEDVGAILQNAERILENPTWR